MIKLKDILLESRLDEVPYTDPDTELGQRAHFPNTVPENVREFELFTYSVFSRLTPAGRIKFQTWFVKQASQMFMADGTANARNLIQQIIDEAPIIENPFDAGVDWNTVGGRNNNYENSQNALWAICSLYQDIYNKEWHKKKVFYTFLADLTKQQTIIIRFIAPVEWEMLNPAENGDEEHVIPANYTARVIMNWVENNQLNRENFDIFMSKQTQCKISDEYDANLRQVGLMQTMPDGWNPLTDSPWDRYRAANIPSQDIVKINNRNIHPPYTLNQQNETKRLQKLAGIIKEKEEEDFNIDKVDPRWNSKDLTLRIVEIWYFRNESGYGTIQKTYDIVINQEQVVEIVGNWFQPNLKYNVEDFEDWLINTDLDDGLYNFWNEIRDFPKSNESEDIIDFDYNDGFEAFDPTLEYTEKDLEELNIGLIKVE